MIGGIYKMVRIFYLIILGALFFEGRAANSDSIKININVFIENSASMDGYVNGVTEFENYIYSMLGEFKSNKFCDTLNLNYINNKIINIAKDANNESIENFITTLESAKFKREGGDRSVSDLKSVIKNILNQVDDKNVSILISDFIFSSNGHDSDVTSLERQGIGIKNDFADKLNKTDLGVIILQLESNFNGIYYDKNNVQIKINQKRPFYIWIVGALKNITNVVNQNLINLNNKDYKNVFVLQSINKTTIPNYKIIKNNKNGNFKLRENAKGPITDAEVSTRGKDKGKFGFELAVDLGKNIQSKKFYLNNSIYGINRNYNLIARINSDGSSPQLKDFTHVLQIQTTKLQNESLVVNILQEIPNWISNISTNDDTKINLIDKNKTYGFKYLVSGVFNAFDAKSKSKIINSIKIKIERN